MNQYIQEQAILYLSKLKQQQTSDGKENQRPNDQAAPHHRGFDLSALISRLLLPAPQQRQARRIQRKV